MQKTNNYKRIGKEVDYNSCYCTAMIGYNWCPCTADEACNRDYILLWCLITVGEVFRLLLCIYALVSLYHSCGLEVGCPCAADEACQRDNILLCSLTTVGKVLQFIIFTYAVVSHH